MLRRSSAVLRLTRASTTWNCQSIFRRLSLKRKRDWWRSANQRRKRRRKEKRNDSKIYINNRTQGYSFCVKHNSLPQPIIMFLLSFWNVKLIQKQKDTLIPTKQSIIMSVLIWILEDSILNNSLLWNDIFRMVILINSVFIPINKYDIYNVINASTVFVSFMYWANYLKNADLNTVSEIYNKMVNSFSSLKF